MEHKEITLTDAAHRLSWSWPRAWKALLTGRLEGEKRDGRWFVTAASVKRLAAERKREDAAPV